MPPKLKYWDFSKEEIKTAQKENKLLLLDVETSNICNLKCPYCFRDVYKEGKKLVLEDELTLSERKGIINQAINLGLKTIKIPGAGEPLTDPLFWKQIDYAKSRGLGVIVFTNGLVLARDESLIKQLKEREITIILKLNGLKSEKVEDRLAGLKGYAKYRKKALSLLLKYGFNKTSPTMLGIDTIICNLNRDEILDIFCFAMENNIFPIIKPFMPIGGALRVKNWFLPKEKIVKLFKAAQRIDREKYKIIYKFSLTYMGAPCDQRKYALFVDIQGNVFVCTGYPIKLGNIRKQSLKEIWEREDLKNLRQKDYYACPYREIYWEQEKL